MTEPQKAKRTNRLSRETSPYLRQHAGNPVDWYPWGEEAFAKAKELDRPVFLSIGYSSCHWCHVMERESFESSEIAGILNDHFVSIKVDREERPDVDAIYMTAVQMITGSGGWPLSVFLTPDLKPFWGGTYFPPDARYGRPGFGDILLRLAQAYREERVRLEEAAEELTRVIRQEDALGSGGELPDRTPILASIQHARESFDPHHGGFGPAPKFPRAVTISGLLREHSRTGEPALLHMCEKTLEAMALGGMYDQIGGGFHRYSTDASWLVPHFEKMLYDNALLARAYTEAYQVTKRGLYARVARETLDYVLREMTSSEGGFFSATDADSEGEEGRFFVWTPAEVEAVLGEADARLVCEYFHISAGGNFEGRKSIPHIPRSIESVAAALHIDPEAARKTIERGRAELYRSRERRVKPFRDEKVLVAWNGLMISALARAYQAFGDVRYLDAARRAAGFIEAKLRPDGALRRTYADGVAKIPAYLDDHANLVEASIDLYESDFDPSHLARAREIADDMLERFWDPASGGFFFASEDHDFLLTRRRDLLDNSTPSGSGVAVLSLLRLERLTGHGIYRDRAEAFFRSVRGHLERIPMAFGITLTALDWLLRPPVEVAIVGDVEGPGGRELLGTIRETFLPDKIVAATTEPVAAEVARAVPLLDRKRAIDGKATAYVCRDFACKEPVTSPEGLAAQLGISAAGRLPVNDHP